MSNDSLMAEVAAASTAAAPVIVDIANQPIDVDIANQPIDVNVLAIPNITVATLPEPVAVEPYLQTVPQLTSAAVNASAAGNNALVAAVAGQIIRVYRLLIVIAAADTMYFRDGAAGAALTGLMSMSQYGSIVLDHDGEPWFTTSAGNAFVLNMTAGVQASGRIYYTQG
jgi:hypothetical protein